MTDRWRDHYDSWKTDAGTQFADVVLDEDGEPVDQDELDAQAEDAAIEAAERRREDMMFDRDSWEDLREPDGVRYLGGGRYGSTDV